MAWNALRGLWRWVGGVALAASQAGAQVDLLREDAPPDASSIQAVGEIEASIDQIGLGGMARPGDWTPIRIILEENTERQREVIIRLLIDDVDGDTAAYMTRLSTNPGMRQPVWLYARLPFTFDSGRNLALSVFEADDSGSGPSDPLADDLGATLGRVLFNRRLSASGTLRRISTDGLIAVVGQREAGLGAYGWRTRSAADWPPFGHEPTDVANGLTVEDLPDRWYGYSTASALVWTDGSPSELGLEQARALREWVERGGHLVIVLPEVGQEWQSVSNATIADMLPAVSVIRHEAEAVEPYRNLIDFSLVREGNNNGPIVAQTRLPTEWTVHELAPLATAEPGEAERILQGPDGKCVVARRLVGTGAVTVVGLNLGARSLAVSGLPHADVFWHRVLGRRGALVDQNSASNRAQYEVNVNARSVYVYDDDLGEEIAKSGRSATGVLLGLIVFAGYWLVAGPVSFFVLKQRSMHRHAWLAFVVAGGAFTALAWGGAWVIRPKSLSLTHLSFVDHVYGQREQRTRTIGSLLVPEYGEATVRVGSEAELEAGGRTARTHLVTAWEPPSSGVGGTGRFPDARAYPVDARSPDAITFPTRATVKQIQMDWYGGLAWRSIRPVSSEGSDEAPTVSIAPPGSLSPVQGIVQHNLPAPLTKVLVIWVGGQRALYLTGSRSAVTGTKNSEPGTLLADARFYFVDLTQTDGEWLAGDDLDLSTVVRGTGTPILSLRSLGTGALTPAPTPGTRDERLLNLALFSLLDPPTFSTGLASNNPIAAHRKATHDLDLSRWFTQPCVMILGIMEGEGADTCPTPFAVSTGGGPRTVRIEGRTVLRWIYPLPDNPPEVNNPNTPDPETDPDAPIPGVG